MIQKLFSPNIWSANATDLASFILRVSLSLLMLTHGFPKLMKFMDGNMEFGDPIGIGVPASFTLTIFAEVICSILILIGFWTRLALIPLIITMLVAAFIVHSADMVGVKEPSLLYLFGYVTLFLLGSGKYAVDAILNKRG